MLGWVAVLASCGPADELSVSETSASVVYGTDDRLEVYAHPDAELQRIARESIVALMPQSVGLERQEDGTYSFFASVLQDQQGLCEDERFADQPVAASCSGTLIDDDLVLTAGHCLSAQRTCGSFHYVFGYYLDGPSLLAPIRDEDVYSCKRVFLERDADIGEVTPDFAVIELDRPVEGSHVPVDIRPASALERGAPLAMIGFGSGLPAKIDSGASVAEPTAPGRDFFVANLDAFEGHSGSATFDSEARLAGILLGGRVPDYVTAPDEDCARVNVFDDSEAGEIAHDISTIVKALCDAGWSRGDVCETSACSGDSCDPPNVPDGGNGGGVPAAKSSGCSAVGEPVGAGSFWFGLLLVLVARRFRQRAV